MKNGGAEGGAKEFQFSGGSLMRSWLKWAGMEAVKEECRWAQSAG